VRLWLKFARSSKLAYISHLDTHRAYYRLFKRANLPIAYSQGFNPHPKMSLTSPLPLGFRSEADYIDLSLALPLTMDEVRECLCKATGSDVFHLLAGRAVADSQKPLASLVTWTEYEIKFEDNLKLEEGLKWFMETEHTSFCKKSKSKTREVNVRALVKRAELEGSTVRAVLHSAEPTFFRPDEFISVLRQRQGAKHCVEYFMRTELYLGTEGLLTPLSL